ncbi:putative hydro-lyase [Neptunicella marina]|uniref:Putative hydro-lyase H8B19_04515 n=1 Tax=Neptunicella marina TaxID=2125989 RepID=A0A8J6LY11_9ALTE|nr:putative hydro-lyase [Neptunicella marina]MBC3765125.1 putative hydro-lyase [Neptunicella marina]
MQQLTPAQIRQKVRNKEITGNTSGLAKGFVQCNMVILPADWASDFQRFCEQNPRPCPLVAVSENPGDIHLDKVGKGIDIRHDLPSYKVFEHGKLINEVTDVEAYWRDDLVTFFIGCSFSFEEALIDDGIEIRNITENKNVPMYRTNIACTPSEKFSGNMVVSMRPMVPADAIRSVQICDRFPSVHGAPVHFGFPEMIGISDINQPDFGDAVTIRQNEVPVFWACGVTPQVALEQAKPPFCITHSPGCMLVSDITNKSLSTGC